MIQAERGTERKKDAGFHVGYKGDQIISGIWSIVVMMAARSTDHDLSCGHLWTLPAHPNLSEVVSLLLLSTSSSSPPRRAVVKPTWANCDSFQIPGPEGSRIKKYDLKITKRISCLLC